MKTVEYLEAQRDRLKTMIQRMNTNAGFDSEDGRKYTQVLVKLALTHMQIEEIKKEAARK
ncbi:hypothetical protein [Paenibacillus aceti]|uniref:Uncharacterized protein n=1 Tax=Paenibacillus aceti TaxID=1820010 RepID=A0ABQ1VZE4_9BACL|nr:hypothetical protein [Paenibacillus aceti]GGG07007.1 hypothetical protein GCM10010913_31040 [Paenibacillus aceti]